MPPTTMDEGPPVQAVEGRLGPNEQDRRGQHRVKRHLRVAAGAQGARQAWGQLQGAPTHNPSRPRGALQEALAQDDDAGPCCRAGQGPDRALPSGRVRSSTAAMSVTSPLGPAPDYVQPWLTRSGVRAGRGGCSRRSARQATAEKSLLAVAAACGQGGADVARSWIDDRGGCRCLRRASSQGTGSSRGNPAKLHAIRPGPLGRAFP